MPYLVLARKYRPQLFSEMVGQAHLTQTLANAVAGDRVAHAYLFCGPRGVGKTTAARILAKALNCESGPTPEPDNSCETCLEITGGRSLDVLEIDGASNRGIEEVRELRENTRYAPTRGRFKVYIVDEAHMLTKEAFNALLKTLEEPPSHVVFVLATTEPFRMPDTILSRCQRFDFARIPAREIAAHMGRLLEAEGREASPEALSLVARRARGGLRDALSALDQILAATEGAVDVAAVERVLGIVGGEVYEGLVDRLAEGDAGGALRLLDATYARGADLGDLAEGLALHLRQLMLLAVDPSLEGILDVSDAEVPRLAAQAQRFPREVLIELVDRAAETAVGLRRSDHPRLLFELALTEMAQASHRVPLPDLARRLLELEARLGGAAPPPSAGPGGGGGKPARTAPAPAKSKPKPPAKPPGKKAEAAPPAASESTATGDDALWQDVLASLKDRSMRVWSTLQFAMPAGRGPDGGLLVRSDKQLVGPMLAEPAVQDLLGEILTSLGHSPRPVRLEGEGKAAAAAPAPAPAEPAGAEPKTPPKAPAEEPESNEEPDTRTMGQLFKEEPLLQKALDMFDGEVLP